MQMRISYCALFLVGVFTTNLPIYSMDQEECSILVKESELVALREQNQSLYKDKEDNLLTIQILNKKIEDLSKKPKTSNASTQTDNPSIVSRLINGILFSHYGLHFQEDE